MGLSAVVDFKVAFLLNAKGLPKMKESQEIRNFHTGRRKEPAGGKCQRKEPGAFWTARQSASRAGRSAAGRGRRELAGLQRPSRKAARRGCPEARGGSRGQRRSAGRPAASACPSCLPAEPGAPLVKEPRGPSPAGPGPSVLSPLTCES